VSCLAAEAIIEIDMPDQTSIRAMRLNTQYRYELPHAQPQQQGATHRFVYYFQRSSKIGRTIILETAACSPIGGGYVQRVAYNNHYHNCNIVHVANFSVSTAHEVIIVALAS
jgi:hypothetical protein